MPRKEEATVNRLREQIRSDRNRLRQRLTGDATGEAHSDAGKEHSRPIRLAEVFRNLVP